jgi:hypothetical protein
LTGRFFWLGLADMKKSRLSKKEAMIAAFYTDHAQHHTEEAHNFIDNLIIASIGAGLVEYDSANDTVTWVGMPGRIFSPRYKREA